MNTRRKSIHQSVVMPSSHCSECLSLPNTTRGETILCACACVLAMCVCVCVPRLRWRDRIVDDLKRLGIPQNWYPLAQNRQAWRAAHSVAMPSPPTRQSVLCPGCERSFSPNGFRRHKCTEQRELPVHFQRGARQCVTCDRWFRSAGGLAVHKCTPPVVLRSRARSPPPPIEHATSRHAVPGMALLLSALFGLSLLFLV